MQEAENRNDKKRNQRSERKQIVLSVQLELS
ncbi:hypothetical protein MAMT_01164 [Methylacidimicrobium tartarophylax]|uniref:Uncharacterized protein n=1 Tax=Methylacidimicrobium tartarophylax TaxID=1041768 RepID=A0A5E6MAE5_9BACT|nr:hypothetical protein MAMT_01164 [Methylacidimicrobium tartarophylax]